MKLFENEVIKNAVNNYNTTMKNLKWPSYNEILKRMILKCTMDEISQRKVPYTVAEIIDVQKKIQIDAENIASDEFKKAKDDYNHIEKEAVNKILDTIVQVNDAPFNNREVVRIIYNRAYNDSCADGMNEVLLLMEDYGHLVSDVLNVLAKD